jgi:tetratricopeptide (TPR) repeat protein
LPQAPHEDTRHARGINPCLFLSHSGADTDAARELKRRILENPAARNAGLSVWFDKDDLRPGRGWQEQIEEIITHRVTAFAVLVGTKGVINWVEREVRLGLARATGSDPIIFVPILARGAALDDILLLPPFVQQHHAVRDPLNDPTEFAKLIYAILDKAGTESPQIVDEPYVGLRAMTEKDADRFFGREAEVDELVEDLRRRRLVAIIADSGAGKSSLAMAGLVPAFRGGALADETRREPDDRLWHVVIMRPGRDPLEGLRRGVTEAAEHMGIPAHHRADLRHRLACDDIGETAYALRCDLPAATTETLLVIDQFDELLTQTPSEHRAPFVDLITQLTNMPIPGGFRVVLTVRVDYFNLCRSFEVLRSALESDYSALRLKRISDEGLEAAVCKPLRMAGYANDGEQRALARNIIRDLGDRPGDLALAQMALWTVWRSRLTHDGSLLRAYVDVGRVYGALAQEAELVRGRLSGTERDLLAPLFVRLVRLGETGGVLRRTADFEEFDEPTLALASKLASDDYGRLLLVSERSVEVCHEALITQWPWLQSSLNAVAADLRILERLIDHTGRWRDAPENERHKYLATGADRELYTKLVGKHDEWLAITERLFITTSEEAFLAEEARRREAQEQRARDSEVIRRQLHQTRKLLAAAVALGLAAATAGGFAWFEMRVADDNFEVANRQKAEAQAQREDAAAVARVARTQLSQSNRSASGVIDSLGDWASPSWGSYIHTMRASTYSRTGDTVHDRRELDLALRLQPELVTLLVSSSDNFLRMGNADGAIRDANKALAAGAPSATAYGNLVIGEAIRRNYQEAINHIDEAIGKTGRLSGDDIEQLVSPDLRAFTNDFEFRIPDTDFTIALRYLKAVLQAMSGDDDYENSLQQADAADRDYPFSRTAYLAAVNWAWLIVRGQAKQDASTGDSWAPVPARPIKDYGAYAAEGALWARIAGTRAEFTDRAGRAFAHFLTAHTAATNQDASTAKKYQKLAIWVRRATRLPIVTRPEPESPLSAALDLKVKAMELRDGPNSGDDGYEMEPAVTLLSNAIRLLDPDRLGRPLGRQEEDALIDLLLLRASWKLTAKDNGGAVADARRIIAIDANLADAHRLLGDGLLDGDARKKHEYEQAIVLDPGNTDALKGLGSIVERDQNWLEALRLLREQRKFRRFWGSDYQHLARLEDRSGDFQRALVDIGTAIEIAPWDRSYLLMRRDIEIHDKTDQDIAQIHYVIGLHELAQLQARTGSDADSLRGYVEAFRAVVALAPGSEATLEMGKLTSDFSAFLVTRFGQGDARQWWQSFAANRLATDREKQIAAAEAQRLAVEK